MFAGDGPPFGAESSMKHYCNGTVRDILDCVLSNAICCWSARCGNVIRPRQESDGRQDFRGVVRLDVLWNEVASEMLESLNDELMASVGYTVAVHPFCCPIFTDHANL